MTLLLPFLHRPDLQGLAVFVLVIVFKWLYDSTSPLIALVFASTVSGCQMFLLNEEYAHASQEKWSFESSDTLFMDGFLFCAFILGSSLLVYKDEKVHLPRQLCKHTIFTLN
jgi:putative flippase GtrA